MNKKDQLAAKKQLELRQIEKQIIANREAQKLKNPTLRYLK